MTAAETNRSGSFGQHTAPSVVDRLGVWLSRRSIERAAGDLRGRDVLDVGCGFEATVVRSLLDDVGHATLVDLAIAPDLCAHPKVAAIVGDWKDALTSLDTGTQDVVMCISVLEHLPDDRSALAEFRRVLRPGGTLIVNVPSWLGKRALEFSAFRLGLSPAEEMDDHKRYYDPRDLWPLIVEAGFAPHAITCRRHKFGLNTLAVSRVEDAIKGTAR